jgi:hypothetical protein
MKTIIAEVEICFSPKAGELIAIMRFTANDQRWGTAKRVSDLTGSPRSKTVELKHLIEPLQKYAERHISRKEPEAKVITEIIFTHYEPELPISTTTSS